MLLLLAALFLTGQLHCLIVTVDGVPADGSLLIFSEHGDEVFQVRQGYALFTGDGSVLNATFVTENLSYSFLIHQNFTVLNLHRVMVEALDIHREPIPPTAIKLEGVAPAIKGNGLEFLAEEGICNVALRYHGISKNISIPVKGPTITQVVLPVADLEVRLLSWQGSPLAGEEVILKANDYFTQTLCNKEGTIFLQDVPLGSVTLELPKQSISVTLVHKGEALEVRLPPKKFNVDVTISANYLLHSAEINVAVATLDGPIENCPVQLSARSFSIKGLTDEHGSIVFHLKPLLLLFDQQYNVTVTLGDYQYCKSVYIKGSPLAILLEVISSSALAALIYYIHGRR